MWAWRWLVSKCGRHRSHKTAPITGEEGAARGLPAEFEVRPGALKFSRASQEGPTMSTRTTTVRPQQRARSSLSAQDAAAQCGDKENVSMNGASAKAKAPRKGSKAYCLCRKPDDGSPMIHCSTCKDWCVSSAARAPPFD